MVLEIFGNLLHYYSIAISFIFGAFIEEWISGRILIKEKRGTKLRWRKKNYLEKRRAIIVRMIEIISIPLISIPIYIGLLFLLEQSKYYVFIITIIIFNTIYLGTLFELPYKIKLKEWLVIVLIYFISFSSILFVWYLTYKI